MRWQGSWEIWLIITWSAWLPRDLWFCFLIAFLWKMSQLDKMSSQQSTDIDINDKCLYSNKTGFFLLFPVRIWILFIDFLRRHGIRCSMSQSLLWLKSTASDFPKKSVEEWRNMQQSFTQVPNWSENLNAARGRQMPWAEPVTGGRWRNNIHNAIDPAGVTEDVTQRVTLTHAAVTRAASLPRGPRHSCFMSMSQTSGIGRVLL